MTTQPDRYQRVLDAYSVMQRAAFDHALDTCDPTLFGDERALARKLDEAQHHAEAQWMHVPCDALDGQTPQAFVATLDEEAARTFLDVALSHLDAPLPTPWAQALKPHASTLLPTLNRWIEEGLRQPWTEDQAMGPEMIRAVRATELLGLWEIPLADSGLLERYLDHPDPPAPWSESVATAVSGRRDADVDRILAQMTERIRTTQGPRQIQDDYLLQALTTVGRDRPDERIYQLLRTAFRQTTPRQHPVILLAEYGDPRAVTLLRRFVIETADTIDETTYVEVIRAIKHLGGQTEDLPNLYAAGRSRPFE